jgi:hypothetical protein
MRRYTDEFFLKVSFVYSEAVALKCILMLPSPKFSVCVVSKLNELSFDSYSPLDIVYLYSPILKLNLSLDTGVP